MPLHILNHHLWFPPVFDALEDGLLAMGGTLTPERILLAYKQGIFPWYDGETPLWWSPNPRFVLFPEQLKVSSTMRSLLKKQPFTVTYNQCFSRVIANCAHVSRKNQDGTWINDDVVHAYTALHQQGWAHSVECWQNNELVGGLYGIRMDKVFFGESMFSLVSNASKYAFITQVKALQEEGVELIDCQVYTEHLESLGAQMIDRNEFINRLRTLIVEA